MSTTQPDAERLQRAVAASIKDHWVLFLVEGILLVILGGAAIIVPPIAGLATTLFLGWLFLISGVMGLVTTLWMRSAPGFWWSLLSAVLAIVAGGLLVSSPVSGLLSLTLVISVFFLADGVATIMYALDHKRELSGRWGWMLFSGVIDIGLAVLIISGLPGTATWAIGLLVGINLVFGGVALIGMALHARDGSLA
jgi:uncharacterized membrane protein HdeD (DUF308 family)